MKRKIIRGFTALTFGVGYVSGFVQGLRNQPKPSSSKLDIPPDPPVPVVDAYRCGTCGSDDVHITAWININTYQRVVCDPPTNQIWCGQCRKMITWDDLMGAVKA